MGIHLSSLGFALVSSLLGLACSGSSPEGESASMEAVTTRAPFRFDYSLPCLENGTCVNKTIQGRLDPSTHPRMASLELSESGVLTVETGSMGPSTKFIFDLRSGKITMPHAHPFPGGPESTTLEAPPKGSPPEVNGEYALWVSSIRKLVSGIKYGDMTYAFSVGAAYHRPNPEVSDIEAYLISSERELSPWHFNYSIKCLTALNDESCVHDRSKPLSVTLENQNHSPTASLSWDKDVLRLERHSMAPGYPNSYAYTLDLKTGTVTREDLHLPVKTPVITLTAPSSDWAPEKYKPYFIPAFDQAYIHATNEMAALVEQIRQGDVVQYSPERQNPHYEVASIGGYLANIRSEVAPIPYF